jgi:hypothetical protein
LDLNVKPVPRLLKAQTTMTDVVDQQVSA